MNDERFSISILNEKQRRPSSSSQQSSVESRFCPSPATCDSGNFSNCEIFAHTADENIFDTDKFDLITDTGHKLLLSQQIIRKLKSELQCLKKSEKWYKSELKIQKKTRIDTLERFYVKERDFLKANQILEFECQKLRILCNHLKSKNKREKDYFQKKLKNDNELLKNSSHGKLEKETTEYKIQKLNKINEEHQALIDLLRKQKQKLLRDLHNLTIEKDGQIMLLEKKSAILEKENSLLVEKCKGLIVENQHLKNPEHNEITTSTAVKVVDHSEIEKLQKIIFLQKLDINVLKKQLSKHNEKKCVPEESIIDQMNVEQKNEICKLEIELKDCKTLCDSLQESQSFLQSNQDKAKNIQFELHEAREVILKKTQINDNLQKTLRVKTDMNHQIFSDFAKLALNLITSYQLVSNNGLLKNLIKKNNFDIEKYVSLCQQDNESFRERYKEVLNFCLDIIKFLQNDFIVRTKDQISAIEYQKLVALVGDIKNIFDDRTLLVAQNVCDEDSKNGTPLQFDIDASVSKNKDLNKIFEVEFGKSLIHNCMIQRLNDILNFKDVIFRDKAIATNLNEESKKASNLKLTNIATFSENENENLSKASVELNNEIFGNSGEKRLQKETKSEIVRLSTVIHDLKYQNEIFQDQNRNLKYQLKTALVQLNEIDTHRKVNNQLKSNLSNLMDDYKAVIQKQENAYKSIASNVNYDKIYALINESNKFVPSFDNLSQTVDGIRSDINLLVQNIANPVCHETSTSVAYNVNKSKFTRQKSLLDELREISDFS